MKLNGPFFTQTGVRRVALSAMMLFAALAAAQTTATAQTTEPGRVVDTMWLTLNVNDARVNVEKRFFSMSVKSAYKSTFYADWNDGTPIDTIRDIVVSNNTVFKHTYKAAGLYNIKVWSGETPKEPNSIPRVDKVVLLEDGGVTALYAPNLPMLSMITNWSNDLQSVDVSGCTALTTLTVTDVANSKWNGKLSDLKTIGCTSLTTLWCYNNKLTNLDVSSCTALTDLQCYNNLLENLNVSGCTALKTLQCHNNKLTNLDVSQNTSLTMLWCYQNNLTSLDVSKNTALPGLYCHYNKLMSLKLGENTILTTLWCNNNELTSLDVSKNTALTTLYCYNNKLPSLDVSSCKSLINLWCYDISVLTSLNVSGCTALKYIYCYNDKLSSLDVSSCTALINLWCQYNRIPLSKIHPAVTQLPAITGRAYNWQADDTTLQKGIPFDLSAELSIGGAETQMVVSPSNNVDVAAGVFTFNKGGDYTISLTNPIVKDADGTVVTFKWNVTVKKSQFTITAKPDEEAHGSTTGSNTYEEDADVTVTATPKTGYRFSKWVHTADQSKVFTTKKDTTFKAAEDLNLTAVFEEDIYTITLRPSDSGTMANVSGSYPAGHRIKISTQANDGYRFVKWVHTNDRNHVFGIYADTTFNLTQDLDLTAVFEKIPTYTITLQVNEVTWSSVSGGGIYRENADVSVQARAGRRYHFVKWVHTADQSKVFTTKSDTTFKATQDLNLTAIFEEVFYDITLQANDASYGEVSGEGRYREEADVVIDATAKSGYYFVKWVYTGTNTVFTKMKRYTFKATGQLALTAVFEAIPENKILVFARPNSNTMGYASVTGDSIHKIGDTVTITAKAKEGYRFTGWKREILSESGREYVFFADSTKKDTTFVVTESMVLVAYFRNVPPHTVIVRANNDEWGSVSGGGTSIQENAETTIRAAAEEGYRFVNWTHMVFNGHGDADEEVFSSETDTTFEVVQNLTLTANFELIPIPVYTIAVNSSDGEMGEVSGGGLYKEDSTVVITATAKEGYRFIEWKKGEEVFSLEAKHEFKAKEDLSLTAYFAEAPLLRVTLTVNDAARGKVHGDGLYKENAEVTIKAEAETGYKFVQWKRGEEVFALSADTIFKITEDISLTAIFDTVILPDIVKTYTIVVRSNNNTYGTATLSTGVDSAVFEAGAEVTIVAETIGEKSFFISWRRTKADGMGEAHFASQATYTFKADEDLVLTAYFDAETCEGNVYVKGRVIYLTNPMGKVQLFNLHGQLLYEGNGTGIPVGSKGMYILRVSDCNKKFKVLVP